MEIGQISSSFMHLFRYTGAQASTGDPCAPHTDSGLITIIPRALGAPGLECHDGRRFVATESLFADVPNVCTILAGETLAALTRGRVRGTVHRVTATPGERFSIPFQLRASDLSEKLRELIVS